MRGPQTRNARVSLAVAAAGISAFALLYAPQPVLPQLAEQYELDPGGASLAVSVATGALAIAVLPIATLAEIIGRRPVILASVTVSVVLGLLLPLAPSYAVLLGIRALQGAAIAGFAGVAAAYLADQLGRAGVAAAVGAMIAGNTIGGMSGRLASGLTAEWIDWHGALTVVTILALICSLVTVVLLPRESGDVHQHDNADSGAGVGFADAVRGVGTALRQRLLIGQYAVALLAMGAFVAMYNVIGFRLTTPPLDLSPTLASLVFCVYAVGTVSSSTAGRLVGRFGRRRILLVALVTTAVGIACTLPDALPVVVSGFVIFTGGFFATHAVANGWTAAEAPATARGQATGLYTLAYYLGSSVGGTTGSVVFTHGGWPWLVAVTIGWLVVGAVVVAVTSATSQQPRRFHAGVV